MGFHHGMAMIWGGVALVDPDRCLGKGSLKIANGGIGGPAKAAVWRFDGIVQFGVQIELAILRRIIDPHQLGGCARIFKCVGDHQRHRLIIMHDRRAAQQRSGIIISLAQLTGIGVGHYPQHAGRCFSRAQVHGRDPSLGDRGPDDPAIDGVGRSIMPFIGIGRTAGNLGRAVDTVLCDADDAALVDGVGGGGRIEFHDRASFCR